MKKLWNRENRLEGMIEIRIRYDAAFLNSLLNRILPDLPESIVKAVKKFTENDL